MSDTDIDLPIYNTPIIDARGNISEVWWRFFATLLARTGGTSGDDIALLRKLVEMLASKLEATATRDESMVPLVPAPAYQAGADMAVYAHGILSDPLLHDVATQALNGFMSALDKLKLDGIAAGAQVNVPTDLAIGTRTATAVPITSSTGSAASFPVATSALAGALSAADKTKLDTVATNATAVTILGTVSQSAGVPTGAVYESGSNANGFYVKYADGTMICRGKLAGLDQTLTTQAYGANLTFAKPFIDTEITINVNIASVNVTNVFRGYCRGSKLDSATFSLVQFWDVVQTYSYTYTAIGRWF